MNPDCRCCVDCMADCTCHHFGDKDCAGCDCNRDTGTDLFDTFDPDDEELSND